MGAPTAVRKQVTAGSTASVFNVPAHSGIAIVPGSGGTMSAKVRLHPDGSLIDLDPATASFAAAATYALLGPVYEVQFGATTADGFGTVTY